METGTVTIALGEYMRLKGLDEQFDDQVNAARANAEATAKTNVLRDRDMYVRENERLRNENLKLRDAVDEASGMNVKLRKELHEATCKVAKAVTEGAIAQAALDAAEAEIKKRDENEKAFLDSISRLREERGRALARCDALLDRGIFARIFNQECWQ